MRTGKKCTVPIFTPKQSEARGKKSIRKMFHYIGTGGKFNEFILKIESEKGNVI